MTIWARRRAARSSRRHRDYHDEESRTAAGYSARCTPTKCKATSTSQPADTAIWSLASISTTAVSPFATSTSRLSSNVPFLAFNFSHHVNELSFGPFYPSLTNPLDNTVVTTESHFYKYQYYLSVVPTIYTTSPKSLRSIDKYHESPSSGSDGLDQHPHRYSKNHVFTNQYAVTEQSHPVPENHVPGVFVKFDIEPIMLTIAEEWSSVPKLFVRLVNVVSGILVAGGWCFQLTEFVRDLRRSKKSGTQATDGILSPTTPADDSKRFV